MVAMLKNHPSIVCCASALPALPVVPCLSCLACRALPAVPCLSLPICRARFCIISQLVEQLVDDVDAGVPFNEGWGQHNTRGVTDWLRAADPTRLINSASGGCDPPPCGGSEGVGDMYDIHQVSSCKYTAQSAVVAFVRGLSVYLSVCLSTMRSAWLVRTVMSGCSAAPLCRWRG
jgi:hypothetical protein